MTPVPLRSLGSDALAFRIDPNSSQTFALELTPAGLNSLALWQRNAFEAQAGEYAFFRGVVLGIAMLLGIAIVSFFIVRQRAVFLAAAAASLIGSRRERGLRPLQSLEPVPAEAPVSAGVTD